MLRMVECGRATYGFLSGIAITAGWKLLLNTQGQRVNPVKSLHILTLRL